MDKLPDCNASIFHLSHENQKNDWDQTPKHNCHTIRRPAQLTTIGYVQANSRSWWSLKRLVHQWTNILDMLTQHDLKCVYNCHNVNLKQRLVFFSQPFSLPHYGQSENILYFQICYMGFASIWRPTIHEEFSDRRSIRTIEQCGFEDALKLLKRGYTHLQPWFFIGFAGVFNHLITWGGPSCMCIYYI